MSDKGLRDRIIAVATEMFADQGYSATSVRQVVEACSCTKPSLYYYFENKETLFSEVVNLHIQAADEHAEKMMTQSDADTRTCIRTALTSFADWAEQNPAAMRLLQRVETQHEEGAPAVNVACARDMHIKMMGDLLERGQARGEVRSELDPFDCALVLAGTISFQFEMYLATETWDRQRLFRTIDLIFDGIAA